MQIHHPRTVAFGRFSRILNAMENFEIRSLVILLGLGLLLAVGAPATTAAPAGQAAPPTTTAWTGAYYANSSLQGSPALVREEPNLDFTWGTRSPDNSVPADNFSARWTRWLYINTPGIWTFTVLSDNGTRMYIDDSLVIDGWADQPVTMRTATVNITQAYHLVRIEYYHKGAAAEFHLSTITAAFPDWHAEYYGDPNLTGAPVFVRDDPQINFSFGTAGPGGGIGGENFGVRWTRALTLDAGRYRFTTLTDDGVRLWVDNQLIVDQWRDQVPKTWTGDVTLTAGAHFVKMEYFNHGGAGTATLNWQMGTGAATPAAPAGEIIVDDGAQGFMKGGTLADWHDHPAGYSNHAFFLQNNTFSQALYSWARWYPPLPRAGQYEVSAYVPANLATTQNARYWIFHGDTFHSRTINQSLYANQWASLGIFSFTGTGGEYVSLGDVTYESARSTVLAVDAVKFTPR